MARVLGDKVAVTEKHYQSLASKRMKEQFARLPIRAWELYWAFGQITQCLFYSRNLTQCFFFFYRFTFLGMFV